MSKTFRISVNATEATFEADTADDAILAYVHEAGYRSIEDAADVCGQSVEEFLSDITVTEA